MRDDAGDGEVHGAHGLAEGATADGRASSPRHADTQGRAVLGACAGDGHVALHRLPRRSVTPEVRRFNAVGRESRGGGKRPVGASPAELRKVSPDWCILHAP